MFCLPTYPIYFKNVNGLSVCLCQNYLEHFLSVDIKLKGIQGRYILNNWTSVRLFNQIYQILPVHV